MTDKITESALEKFAIALLEKQGFEYIYAQDVAPDTDSSQRESFGDVILLERLRQSATRINPEIPLEVIEVNYKKDGEVRGDYVWLIDFQNPENNDFVV